MLSNSIYRLTPYIFVLFFTILSLIYGAWMYIASTSYSGSVSSVENGTGIYKKYPIKSKISYALPFEYGLSISKGSQGWDFKMTFDKLQDDNLKVSLNLMSPVTNKYDQHLVLSQNGEGAYQTIIECKEGQWNIEILVELKDQTYIIAKRIFLHDKKFINEPITKH